MTPLRDRRTLACTAPPSRLLPRITRAGALTRARSPRRATPAAKSRPNARPHAAQTSITHPGLAGSRSRAPLFFFPYRPFLACHLPRRDSPHATRCAGRAIALASTRGGHPPPPPCAIRILAAQPCRPPLRPRPASLPRPVASAVAGPLHVAHGGPCVSARVAASALPAQQFGPGRYNQLFRCAMI